jgi:hypothetical protein
MAHEKFSYHALVTNELERKMKKITKVTGFNVLAERGFRPIPIFT